MAAIATVLSPQPCSIPGTPCHSFPVPCTAENLPVAIINLQSRLASIFFKMRIFEKKPNLARQATEAGKIKAIEERINKDVDWFLLTEREVGASILRMTESCKKAILSRQYKSILAKASLLPPVGEFVYGVTVGGGAGARGSAAVGSGDAHGNGFELLLQMEDHRQQVEKRLGMFADFSLEMMTAVTSREIELVQEEIRYHIGSYETKKTEYKNLLPRLPADEQIVLEEQYKDIQGREAVLAESTVYFKFEVDVATILLRLKEAFDVLDTKIVIAREDSSSAALKWAAAADHITTSILPLFSHVVEAAKGANKLTSRDVLNPVQRIHLERYRAVLRVYIDEVAIYADSIKGINFPPPFQHNVAVKELQMALGEMLKKDETELDHEAIALEAHIGVLTEYLPVELRTLMEGLIPTNIRPFKNYLIVVESVLDEALDKMPAMCPIAPPFLATPTSSVRREDRVCAGAGCPRAYMAADRASPAAAAMLGVRGRAAPRLPPILPRLGDAEYSPAVSAAAPALTGDYEGDDEADVFRETGKHVLVSLPHLHEAPERIGQVSAIRTKYVNLLVKYDARVLEKISKEDVAKILEDANAEGGLKSEVYEALKKEIDLMENGCETGAGTSDVSDGVQEVLCCIAILDRIAVGL